MPKSKGRKRTPQTKLPPPNPPIRKPWWRRHWKIVATGIGSIPAIIGFASAVATFLPRVTIDVADPVEPSNAFSAPVTVANNFVPLEQVKLALGVCKIVYGGIGGATLRSKRGDCNAGSRVLVTGPEMAGHHLATDDKWRVLLKDFADPPNFGGGDITMVIQYTPWPWSCLHADWLFGHEKQFRFRARNDANGKWQWFPATIDEPY